MALRNTLTPPRPLRNSSGGVQFAAVVVNADPAAVPVASRRGGPGAGAGAGTGTVGVGVGVGVGTGTGTGVGTGTGTGVGVGVGTATGTGVVAENPNLLISTSAATKVGLESKMIADTISNLEVLLRCMVRREGLCGTANKNLK